jgi:hypothetical protein
MEEREFQSLLETVEAETLDFKARPYNLSDEAERLALVKDVLCMTNSPREGAAHIVLGVKKYPDGRYDLLGVETHPDDADVQAQFTHRVYPHPPIRYEPVNFQGKSFGVIHILPERIGPCVPGKDYGNVLRERQVYVRHGSRNDIATPNDLLELARWLRGEDSVRAGQQPTDLAKDTAWRAFLEGVHQLESGRRYVLMSALGETPLPPNASAIGELDWTFVLDFDPDSEESGLLKVCKPSLEERRSLLLMVTGDRPSLDLVRTTHWFFARGLSGRHETVATGAWRAWQQRYGLELKEQLIRFAKMSNPSPVTFVALWYSPTLPDHLHSVLEAGLACLGEAMDCVLVCDHPATTQSVTAKFGVNVVSIPLDHLCAGIETIIPSRKARLEPSSIPSASGVPVQLGKDDISWIEQEVEIVHLGLGRVAPENRVVGRDFLRGSEIDWYELGLHYDVDREAAKDLIDRIISDLQSRRATRVNLNHAPGAGGTTLARRVLWDIHHKYPCGLLHSTEPFQTAERLYKLAQTSKQPVLLAIDSSEISEGEVDSLFELLRARHLPVVCFQVLRRFGRQKGGVRSFSLASALTDTEASHLVHVLTREVPERKASLEQLLQSNDARMRSAFFFGLQAFGKDFQGLERYVQTRLQGLSLVQRKIMGLLAMAHHYAQKPIPSQAFCQLLQMPPAASSI